MKKRAFVIANHLPTQEQHQELREKWKVREVVTLPDDLARLWANIPPELPFLVDYLQPIVTWLNELNAGWKEDDIAWVQGEAGAQHYMVLHCQRDRYMPVLHATSRREVVEETLADGSTRSTRVFRHVRFRIYIV